MRCSLNGDQPDSPGCALGIVQSGKLTYKRGYGMASLEHGVPICCSVEVAQSSGDLPAPGGVPWLAAGELDPSEE